MATSKLSARFAFFYSIRFRMALWFTVVLAVALVMFSLFVYFREARSTYDESASRLMMRLRELNLALQESDSEESFSSPKILTPMSLGPFNVQHGELVIITDETGVLLNYWGPIDESAANQLATMSVNMEIKGRRGIFTAYIQNGANAQPDEYVNITAPIGQEGQILGWVTIGEPVDPSHAVSRLILTLLLSGLITLAAAAYGGYWLAGRTLKPIKEIIHTAQEISGSDLDRRLNIQTRDELGELAGTFDQMLDRLQAAFTRQRQFTADASHELRTPLTIMGLEASRALSAGRSLKEIHASLGIIQSENEFMTRLVSELLTLARMDAGQVALRRDPLDLSDLALEMVERYAPMASRKGVTLEAGELPELTICGDRPFLGQMIGNLVDNAIKYSPAGSRVQVETGQDTTHAWLRVSDNGPGIAADHLPHIFDRFYRVDSARSHNNPDNDLPAASEPVTGSGLGLSIVQWIVDVHGGAIKAESEPGSGTTFEVRLPLAPEAPSS